MYVVLPHCTKVMVKQEFETNLETETNLHELWSLSI